MLPELDDRGRRLLAAHDELIRGAAELSRATGGIERRGPLWLGLFGDRGMVTYRDLGDVPAAQFPALIAEVVEHFAALGVGFEWKTRGHDQRNDALVAALLAAGFQPDPAETVMIGEPDALRGAAVVPDGLVLRQAGVGRDLAEDVAAVGRLHAGVFPHHDAGYDERTLIAVRERPDQVQLWLVTDGDAVVCAGRVELDAPVAGLWGGATDPSWRGRGLYRALTAARAGAAHAAGCTLIYAECTPFSRPILQRSGLVPVTTTTPYLWPGPIVASIPG